MTGPTIQYDAFASKFSIGASVLKSDLYVDVVLTGTDDLVLLDIKRRQLTKMLEKAGLVLTKFYSNSTSLVDGLQSEVKIQLDVPNTVKALGLAWKPWTMVVPCDAAAGSENANAAKLLNVVDTVSAIRSSVLSLRSAVNVIDAIISHLMSSKLEQKCSIKKG